ncbi:MAG: hypothetical protein RL095_922 [Verrucomicrobiota bacterium]|jgi:hypothetical protein
MLSLLLSLALQSSDSKLDQLRDELGRTEARLLSGEDELGLRHRRLLSLHSKLASLVEEQPGVASLAARLGKTKGNESRALLERQLHDARLKALKEVDEIAELVTLIRKEQIQLLRDLRKHPEVKNLEYKIQAAEAARGGR